VYYIYFIVSNFSLHFSQTKTEIDDHYILLDFILYIMVHFIPLY